MGKDVTLTGRIHLWEYAAVSIEKHPMLGVADWQFGCRRYYGITNKYGIHFTIYICELP
jgi:hypothetical protein